ncbi:MAG: 3-hydroxyacyl-ACP dehydratase FabZ family protein [Planctomycetota bacterium]
MGELTSQPPPAGTPSGGKQRGALLFEIDGLDLDAVHDDREGIARWIPHRGQMALLDAVVWVDNPVSRAIGRWDVGHDEFWVEGHFPGLPLLPGVLQLEAGAQLACYAYNNRQGGELVGAFVRIENAVFRRSVSPGDRLLLLVSEVKISPRRFISDIQGVVDGQVAFEARITGMNINNQRPS